MTPVLLAAAVVVVACAWWALSSLDDIVINFDTETEET